MEKTATTCKQVHTLAGACGICAHTHVFYPHDDFLALTSESRVDSPIIGTRFTQITTGMFAWVVTAASPDNGLHGDQLIERITTNCLHGQLRLRYQSS